MDLRSHVSRAKDILHPECSDADAASSASSDDDSDTISPRTEKGLELRVARPLAQYVDLLMDLCPTLEQTYRKLHQTKPRLPKEPAKLNVTSAALPYIGNVRDKYPLASSFLVERLGEANWQRHERLRTIANEDRAIVPLPQSGSSLSAKSLFQPVSIFKDSALGSSLPAESARAPTVASHSSFVSSIDGKDNEPGCFRVPTMPVTTDSELLTCPFCRQDISLIHSRVEWK